MLKLKGEKGSTAQKMFKKALAKPGLPMPGMGQAAQQQQTTYIKGKTEDKHNQSESESDSDFLSDDDEYEAMREQRLQAMKKKFERRQEFLGLGHGEYTEVAEDEFLPSVTKSKYAVCHFYKDEFQRCKIMDMHLKRIAPKYIATKFIKLNAEKAPFFVQKLNVRVLPSVVCFKDGIAIDRVVGFEGLGGDEFKTIVLEKRLQQAAVLVLEDDNKDKERGHTSSIRKSTIQTNDGSDDEEF